LAGAPPPPPSGGDSEAVFRYVLTHAAWSVEGLCRAGGTAALRRSQCGRPCPRTGRGRRRADLGLPAAVADVSIPSTSGELLRLYGERALFIARTTLSQFVAEHVEKVRTEVRFDYVVQQDAPRTFPELSRAYTRSAETGEPLAISSEHSESVVYADAEVNFAMRFWHDVQHVRLGLTFELIDELELALWHLSVLQVEGFGPDTVVWQLLHADLVGSVYVMSLSRRFPVDQLRFAEGCVSGGLDRAVLDEVRGARR
jgi:hypothetical protein